MLAELRMPLIGILFEAGVNTRIRRLVVSVTYRLVPSQASAIGVGVALAADRSRFGVNRSSVLVTFEDTKSICPRTSSGEVALTGGMRLKISTRSFPPSAIKRRVPSESAKRGK